MKTLFSAVGGCLEAVLSADSPGEAKAVFLFPPDFVGFAGHFPGSPVLPGIAQIMCVVYLCGTDGPVRLQAIKKCKFARPVAPGERVLVAIQTKPDGDARAVSAELWAGETLCASMALVVCPAEGGQ